MGQAVGTAAGIAVRHHLDPRGVGELIVELQQALLRHDSYLPRVRQEFSMLTKDAGLTASSGNPEPLRDGTNRPVGEDQHCWEGRIGDSVEYAWDKPRMVANATLILDSALARLIAMSYHQKDNQLTHPPKEMTKDLRLEIRTSAGWKLWRSVKGNHQRLLRIEIGVPATGVRATFDSTWGSEKVRVYAFYME